MIDPTSYLKDMLTPSRRELARLVELFQREIGRGLAGEESTIAMHPSFVSRPSGGETGRFVALDLGGSNVRVTIVEPNGRGSAAVKRQESFRLTTTAGDARDLVGPVAEFIGTVLGSDSSHELGFIFSFPVQQDSVRSGRLEKWTKEFAFDGVEGEDVVTLLEDALTSKSADVPALQNLSVSALANDTVSTLAWGAYLDRRCDMGLIVATGMNMAVAIDRNLVSKPLPPTVGALDEMIFNMECGNFVGVEAIHTVLDKRLDSESDTQGQLLEKMISGRYLGELVRLAVADLESRGDAFSGWTTTGSAFAREFGFTAEHLSDIVYDESPELVGVGMLLRKLGVAAATVDDRHLLKHACRLMATRSARLVATGIAATTLYADPELESEHVVAVDGSLFRGYPGYQAEVQAGLRELIGEIRSDQVQVTYLRDASGVGAAIIAAVASE